MRITSTEYLLFFCSFSLLFSYPIRIFLSRRYNYLGNDECHRQNNFTLNAVRRQAHDICECQFLGRSCFFHIDFIRTHFCSCVVAENWISGETYLCFAPVLSGSLQHKAVEINFVSCGFIVCAVQSVPTPKKPGRLPLLCRHLENCEDLTSHGRRSPGFRTFSLLFPHPVYFPISIHSIHQFHLATSYRSNDEYRRHDNSTFDAVSRQAHDNC